MAGDLSGGEQQMLALGGALMTRPELLMIDELSLGLAPTIVGQLLEVVQEIHRRGTTIVIVEQSVNIALNLAEREIGSAPCRERVCQYVYISVVAGTLKKKKDKNTHRRT